MMRVVDWEALFREFIAIAKVRKERFPHNSLKETVDSLYHGDLFRICRTKGHQS